MPEDENLLSGALDLDALPQTADGLRQLIYGAGFTQVKATYLNNDDFPVFIVKHFSLTDDFGFVINVWAVRDRIETFQVIGGVSAHVDKSQGYVKAYQTVLDQIFASNEASVKAIKVVDHVITKYLTDGAKH